MKALRVGLLTLAVCTLSPALALGNPADAGVDPGPSWLAHRGEPAQPAAAESGTGSVVVRSLAATALLAGLGAAALFLRKRRGQLPANAFTYRISVLGSTRVGPKAHAVVASVGGRILLLGVTDSAVQRLAWLDDGSESNDDTDDADADSLPRRHDLGGKNSPTDAPHHGGPDGRDDIPTRSAKPSTPDPVRRTAELRPAKVAPRARAASPRGPAATEDGSTFRDLLSRWTKGEETGANTGLDSAAAIVASSTEDVFVNRNRGAVVPERPAAGGQRIEGQARGLAARLQGNSV